MDSIHQAIERVILGEGAYPFPLPYNYSSPAAEASCVVKKAGAYLFGFTVSNANAAARFVQWFDATTLPGNGAVPSGSVSVAAAGDRELAWIPPRYFHAGIVIAASTTQNTLTIASADHVFDVQFV